MVDHDTHQNEDDVFEEMSREELEAFARDATHQLAKLQEAFERLTASAKANAHVNPAVIDRWRSWMDTLEDERREWADMATTFSTDNKQLLADVEGLQYALSEAAAALEFVIGAAEKSLGESKRVVSFKRALTRIAEKSTEVLTGLYEHYLGWPGDDLRKGNGVPAQAHGEEDGEEEDASSSAMSDDAEAHADAS